MIERSKICEKCGEWCGGARHAIGLRANPEDEREVKWICEECVWKKLMAVEDREEEDV